MTIDEIVQKIYEERYQDPKDPEVAAYMRDGMIREVVQRALELATGSLAVDFVDDPLRSRPKEPAMSDPAIPTPAQRQRTRAYAASVLEAVRRVRTVNAMDGHVSISNRNDEEDALLFDLAEEITLLLAETQEIREIRAKEAESLRFAMVTWKQRADAAQAALDRIRSATKVGLELLKERLSPVNLTEAVKRRLEAAIQEVLDNLTASTSV